MMTSPCPRFAHVHAQSVELDEARGRRKPARFDLGGWPVETNAERDQ